MPPEAHPDLEHLFEQVRSQPRVRRRAYLAEISSGDDELRRQLEALLATEEEVSGDWHHPATALGRVIGGYRLLAALGHGGMAEVFLAEDTRLNRRVALKLLPERLTGHPDRVSRFQREARAASALTHPNILTIHDFGEHEGRHFIASEFVDGRTLRELLHAGPVALPEAVTIAIQIADALAAAHEAGIIHRDIKPENVMQRPDGYIKVLDFGLAKLAEASASGEDSGVSPPQPATFATRVGAVLGTVNYMSPEQARGQKVDPRSDLFSLGVVLYELVTGRRPFEGATPSHVLVAILDNEAAPLAALRPETPWELQRIVAKALSKQPEERYATARELASDLKALSQAWPSGAGSTAEKEDRPEKAAVPWRGAAPGRPGTGALDSARPQPASRRRRIWAVAALVATTTVFVVTVGVLRGWFRSGTEPPSAGRDRLEMTRVTTSGDVNAGYISADGKHLAYLVFGLDGPSLRVRDIATGADRQLVPPGPAAYWALAFAPDAQSVYYVTEESNRQVGGTLYRISIAGGAPQALTVNVAQASVTPDGRRLLLRRWQGEPRISVLLSTDLAAGDERLITSGTTSRGLLNFACSPDGTKVAYATFTREGAEMYWDLVEKPLEGGAERVLIAHSAEEIAGLAWLPDSRDLIVSREDKSSGMHQLWYLDGTNGALRRITRDLNNYSTPQVMADGSGLVATQGSRPARIWIGPVADPGRARPIGVGTANYGDLAWMPDGRLVYTQSANGETNLWIMTPDSGAPTQLTRNASANMEPDVSPDGRTIVFLSNRAGGALRLWRMDADGGNPRQLTEHDAGAPHCAPDGKWVVYHRPAPLESTIWKVPIDGGTPVQVLESQGGRPAVSPDGRWLAYQYFDDAMKRNRVAARPLSGDAPVRLFDPQVGYGSIRWTPDGSHLAYISDGKFATILLQPLAGGPPTEYRASSYQVIFGFTLSRDGSQIAYAAGQHLSDLVMLRNFR